MGSGAGSGLTPRSQGDQGGEYTVTLIGSQLGQHTHPVNCLTSSGSSDSPAGNVWADSGGRVGPASYATAGPATISMNAAAVQPAGSSQAHNNLQPYLTVTFVIALQGIYPSRG